MVLNELDKKQFLTKSKSKTPLRRYSRRLEIQSVTIKNIKLMNLSSETQSDLDIIFEVSSASGSGSYQVFLKLVNIIINAKRVYQTYYIHYDSLNKSVVRRIAQLALRVSLNNNDIRIYCSCPDFTYRFAYVATINNYNYDESTAQNIPANIRNPYNLGSGCKHCVRVLTTTSKWQPSVITAITSLFVKNPSLFIN